MLFSKNALDAMKRVYGNNWQNKIALANKKAEEAEEEVEEEADTEGEKSFEVVYRKLCTEWYEKMVEDQLDLSDLDSFLARFREEVLTLFRRLLFARYQPRGRSETRNHEPSRFDDEEEEDVEEDNSDYDDTGQTSLGPVAMFDVNCDV